MSRLGRALAVVALCAGVLTPTAAGHAGNPNFRSLVHGISPAASGLQVQVLGYDNQLQLTNHTGKVVTVYGYQHEPYARLLPDGTVEENVRSPAVYLNEDRFGQTPVPKSADPKAVPQWKELDETGRFVWHDHRMHWMSHTLPPQVKDKGKKTKIFDYQVPISVGTHRAAIQGTLLWVGTGSGFPVAALVSLIVVALLAIAGVVWRRRRRGVEETAASTREAW